MFSDAFVFIDMALADMRYHYIQVWLYLDPALLAMDTLYVCMLHVYRFYMFTTAIYILCKKSIYLASLEDRYAAFAISWA